MTDRSSVDPSADDPREGRILAAVGSLVDTLLQDFDVVETLTQLSEYCVELLDVASAGLLLADPSQHLHLMAATSESTRELELFQLQTDEGPCLECFVTGEPVTVADLRADAERWPRFAAAADAAGFSSAHVLPMRAAGLVLGALGLFGTTVGELNSADLALGQTLAHIATVAIIHERAPSPSVVLPRMRTALTSRIVVEQAKGFLRGRLGVSIDEAFLLLRRYARSQDLHLTNVSRSLIADPTARSVMLDGIVALMAEPSA